MSRLGRIAGSLGAVGAVLASVFVFDPQTGRLAQVRLGPFALFDRRRWDARRARRAKRGKNGAPPSAPGATSEGDPSESDLPRS